MLQGDLSVHTLLVLLCLHGVKAVDLKTCEGETARLTCAQGNIKVLSANYGRTDRTTCSTGRPANQLLNDQCRQSTSLSVLTTQCDAKQSCSIVVGNTGFTDPCPGTYKYLNVSYVCKLPPPPPPSTPAPPPSTPAPPPSTPAPPPSTPAPPPSTHAPPPSTPAPPAEKTVIICHDKSRTIKCEGKRRLKIHFANYGRRDNVTCPPRYHKPMSTMCISSETRNLQKKCNGKKLCNLHASNSNFTDRCPRTHKYLEVSYSCK